MCLLWFLLQLAVIFMYWDLPPLERGKARESVKCQNTDAENEREHVEEGDDEEKPLMGSQELGGSYGAVVISNSTAAALPNSAPNHTSLPCAVPPDTDEPSSLCCCLSQGGWLTVSFWSLSHNCITNQPEIHIVAVCNT